MAAIFASPCAGARANDSALCDVAFSVAEAALSSGPNSPSFNQSMATLMDAPALREPWEELPRKQRRAASFAGQPLWSVVEHAKERQRVKTALPAESSTRFPNSMLSRRSAAIDDYDSYAQEVLVARSADPSPVDTTFSYMNMRNGVPRLSAREFAADAEQRAAVSAHARTQSDSQRTPPQVLRSQRSQTQLRERPNTRLPSLAQIQAKMNRGSGVFDRMHQVRSDSVDSVDSDGPQTPTDDVFEYFGPRVAAPEPTAKESRLAPFLRERTNGRLARPRSMPATVDDDDESDRFETRFKNRFSTPPRPSTAYVSLPPTPQSLRTVARWSPRSDVTLIVTPPPKLSHNNSPTSPTESVTSIASSTPSLPIITCTPAGELDSDSESEADVIVFSSELEDDDDRREREKRGMEMRNALARRSS